MKNPVQVLCDCEDCIYWLFIKNEGSAYKKQCGNDEIEIGMNPETGHPQCCTYEKTARKPKKKK